MNAVYDLYDLSNVLIAQQNPIIFEKSIRVVNRSFDCIIPARHQVTAKNFRSLVPAHGESLFRLKISRQRNGSCLPYWRNPKNNNGIQLSIVELQAQKIPKGYFVMSLEHEARTLNPNFQLLQSFLRVLYFSIRGARDGLKGRHKTSQKCLILNTPLQEKISPVANNQRGRAGEL